MLQFNVIIEDNGKFIPYDIVPYLLNRYKKEKEKPVTIEEFRKFIDSWAKYQWWSRCEYEIILSDWPGQTKNEKWDVYKQVSMNLDLITKLIMKEVNDSKTTHKSSSRTGRRKS